jgi:hypothetical protein
MVAYNDSLIQLDKPDISPEVREYWLNESIRTKETYLHYTAKAHSLKEDLHIPSSQEEKSGGDNLSVGNSNEESNSGDSLNEANNSAYSSNEANNSGDNKRGYSSDEESRPTKRPKN